MNKKSENAALDKKIIFPTDYVVIAADLSLKRPGFCRLKISPDQDGNPHIHGVRLYSVDNKTNKTKPHGELLKELMDCLQDIYTNSVPILNPIYFCREKEVMKMKVPSERSVTKAVGVCDLFAWKYGKTWQELYPVTVKKLVTGNGKATKEDVAAALPYYLGNQTYKNDDESDAAAVAVAFLIKNGQIKGKEVQP